MEVLLDTNFVISCILRKIDFIEELKGMGFVPVLPREVLQELKDIRQKTNREERTAIDIAFEIFEKSKIKKTSVGGINVDEALITKGKSGVHIATLDAGIKSQIPNVIVISDAKNSLVVEKK